MPQMTVQLAIGIAIGGAIVQLFREIGKRDAAKRRNPLRDKGHFRQAVR